MDEVANAARTGLVGQRLGYRNLFCFAGCGRRFPYA